MGLKQYLSQNTSTSGTERVIDEFNRVISLCTGGARPAPVTNKKPTSSGSGPQTTAPAQPASAGGTPRQVAAGEHPPVRVGPWGNRRVGAPSGKSNCDKIDVDGLVAEAKNQFNAGSASSALALMGAALGCRQDDLMYRLAGTYACRAHDIEAAKQYFGKLPAQFQTAIEQACQSEGIDIRGS